MSAANPSQEDKTKNGEIQKSEKRIGGFKDEFHEVRLKSSHRLDMLGETSKYRPSQKVGEGHTSSK